MVNIDMTGVGVIETAARVGSWSIYTPCDRTVIHNKTTDGWKMNYMSPFKMALRLSHTESEETAILRFGATSAVGCPHMMFLFSFNVK